MTSSRLWMLAFCCALLAGGAIAQPPCFIGDDGFGNGCCSTPLPNLPSPPTLTMTANYTCIQNCQPGNPQIATVTIGSPSYFLCDYAIIPITVAFPGGFGFGGAFLGKYARTWREIGATGTSRQVWRFLVNSDLPFAAPATTAGCPAPACSVAPAALPVHWDGHIDYACDPLSTTGGYQALISLSHMPGCLSHAPFATYPLAGAQSHPNISYHLVGPAPFAFALPIAEPQGAIVAEAVRSSSLVMAPFSYQCFGEAPVLQGALTTNTSNCLCSPVLPIVGPWKQQSLSGTVCCMGATFPFNTIPLPGTPLPTGLNAQTLGAWGGAPGGFPGNRELTFYVGVMQYTSPCTTSSFFPIHAVVGVATARHQVGLFTTAASSCGPVPPFVTTCLDLHNMLGLVGATTGPLFPSLGGLFASTLVLNLNLP